jgi:hypothetical protein
MTTIKPWFFLISIYQFGPNFVKQLFRIQIQKGKKVLLWNQVKSRMEACYSELILDEEIWSFPIGITLLKYSEVICFPITNSELPLH